MTTREAIGADADDDESALAALFRLCVEQCMASEEFMREYRRLTGSQLLKPRTPLDVLIDNATGAPAVNDREARAFFEFVRTYVFETFIASQLADAATAAER